MGILKLNSIAIGGNDSLADFLLYTGLVAVAHQKHGVDVACGS
jgi:hypothetical protein